MFGYNVASQVTTAIDGQQAVEAAEKRHYDLILMDLQMGRLDGFAANQRIRDSPLAGDPCVVALTANADKVGRSNPSVRVGAHAQATEERCISEGFHNYLSKPLDIPKLGIILEDVYQYRQQHGAVIASRKSSTST